MPAGANVWYTDSGRFGTIGLQATTFIKIDGERVKVPGLRLKLIPAWPGGTDPDNPTRHRSAGPEFIDLDDMLPGNLEACMNKVDPATGDQWGSGWKKQLVKWMKHPSRQKLYGFREGDPRMKNRVRQSLTVERIEEINKALVESGKEPLAGGYAPPSPSEAQAVTKGVRGRSA